jgi:hypothetical protein
MSEPVQVLPGDRIRIVAQANVTNVRGIEFDAMLHSDYFEIESVTQLDKTQLDHFNYAEKADSVNVMASNSAGNVVTGLIDVVEIICAVKDVNEAVNVEINCLAISYRDKDNKAFDAACIPSTIEILTEIVETSNFVLSFRIEKL